MLNKHFLTYRSAKTRLLIPPEFHRMAGGTETLVEVIEEEWVSARRQEPLEDQVYACVPALELHLLERWALMLPRCQRMWHLP
jgi:hypothetical protein